MGLGASTSTAIAYADWLLGTFLRLVKLAGRVGLGGGDDEITRGIRDVSARRMWRGRVSGVTDFPFARNGRDRV